MKTALILLFGILKRNEKIKISKDELIFSLTKELIEPENGQFINIEIAGVDLCKKQHRDINVKIH